VEHPGSIVPARGDQNVAFDGPQRTVSDASSHHPVEHRAVFGSDNQEIRLDAAHDTLDRTNRPRLLEHDLKAGALHSSGIEVQK
jgi:hypothetical protein